MSEQPATVRVVIVDDHAMFRAGVRAELSTPAAAALVAGLVGMWFMLAYSYVYINCAVFPVAGALIAYAYDVAERTVAARKECCRKVETRRAYRAALDGGRRRAHCLGWRYRRAVKRPQQRLASDGDQRAITLCRIAR